MTWRSRIVAGGGCVDQGSSEELLCETGRGGWCVSKGGVSDDCRVHVVVWEVVGLRWIWRGSVVPAGGMRKLTALHEGVCWVECENILEDYTEKKCNECLHEPHDGGSPRRLPLKLLSIKRVYISNSSSTKFYTYRKGTTPTTSG